VEEWDHELGALLCLDGYEFQFAHGYRVKIEAAIVAANRNRPHGVKYSLTLHDPEGKRIYGMDNAHAVKRKAAFDHRHVYGGRKTAAYTYRSASRLLDDFYREVDRILAERGIA
jgi:Family of unknown function (DUF6516)